VYTLYNDQYSLLNVIVQYRPTVYGILTEIFNIFV